MQYLLISLLSLYVCSYVTAGYLKTETKLFSVFVGETQVNISQEVFPTPTTCGNCISDLSFLNLHENENTSVVAARSFLYTNGGSLTKFVKKTPSRYVTFVIGKTTYTVDPNRMFTDEGIKASLQTNGMYSDEAAAAVKNLADEVLSIYGFSEQPVVLALHNNGDGYGADSYLPGGPYANDAEEVFIVPGSNPSDFFYVVDPNLYEAIAQMEYNVVLQNNDTVTNDGSLSYYCGLMGMKYINFEAVAETTAYGKQVVLQFDMIEAIKQILFSDNASFVASSGSPAASAASGSGTCSCTQYGGGYCSGFCNGNTCPCMNCQYWNQMC